jgi:hypothetical protein
MRQSALHLFKKNIPRYFKPFWFHQGRPPPGPLPLFKNIRANASESGPCNRMEPAAANTGPVMLRIGGDLPRQGKAGPGGSPRRRQAGHGWGSQKALLCFWEAGRRMT